MDGLSKLFAIASAILVGIVGALGWFNHTVTQSANVALAEVSRVAEIQSRAQKTRILSLELLTSQTPEQAAVAALGLKQASEYFKAQQDKVFVPPGFVARQFYAYEASAPRQDAQATLPTLLRTLAVKTADLSRAETNLDKLFTASAIRAQTRSDLLLGLKHLIYWHRAVIETAGTVVKVFQIMMVPIIALTLGAIWWFLIKPSRRREEVALSKLRESEAWALDLAKSASAANDAKSEFLAVMSHELRTPMNGVLGMAEVLDSEIRDPAHRELLGVLMESGESLKRVLGDLLNFTRLEVGKMQFEAEPFDPAHLAEYVARNHEPVATNKGLKFIIDTVNLPPGQLLGDQHRIQQILSNIVSNAIKFTEKGHVKVALGLSMDGYLDIKVSDTGVGMSDAQKDRMFEWFTQGDGSTARKFGGTGLGMSIVKRLADAMNGKIHVETALDQGTAIQVALPLAKSTDLKTAKGLVDATLKLPKNLNVLIVDDIPTNLMLLEMMIQSFGARPRMASSGQEAIDSCNSKAFDVLLLDISMPDMDGVEALARIRQIEVSKGRNKAPAIAVTASAMEHQVVAFLDAGFDDLVAKPVNAQALHAAISKHVANAGVRPAA